jgi:uncharacterized protein (TIGR02145 family)
MAENLNYNPGIGNSVCYGNNTSNCTDYGRLYDWSTAMGFPSSCNSSTCSGYIQSKHQGICPDGWHLPSDAEWTTLTDYVGGSSTAGTKLKATSGWIYGKNTDEYGFSALPGGLQFSDGSFVNVGNYGEWWSIYEGGSSHAYCRYMIAGTSPVYGTGHDKSYLHSVRCVQD